MRRLGGLCFLASAYLACGCAPAGPAAAPAAAEPRAVVSRSVTGDGVLVATLDNGMTVLLKATRAAPVVCVRGYVRAGGLYEREYLGCGLSHLLEHLVAKESIHETPGGGEAHEQRADEADEIGGQANAYTSLAHTCYYIAAAAGKTMECIDLIADQLARPRITPEDFRREHGVVQREQELGSESPSRLLWETHAASAFGSHPAAVPVIGHAGPLRGVGLEDVLAYHARTYVPQNMVFVVVGDVDVEACLDRVRRAFAGFERGRTPDLSLPEVPTLAGVRRVVREAASLTETLQEMSFQTVDLLHEDLHALDVLSYVLTQGPASRLVRRIEREQQLVTSIGSSSWTPEWGRGMFSIDFRTAPDKADAAEAAILAELKAVAEGGVQDDELDRAKRQKVADLVYAQQTAESQAATIAGDYLATGDVAFSRHYTRRIQAVTAAEVQAAARKYFTFDRMAVTRLVPPGGSGAAGAGEAPGGEDPAPSCFALPNGLRVVLRPSRAVELVSMAFVATGGLLLETPQTNGLGTLMAALSTQGAGGRSAEEISALFDRAGGAVRGQCGNNTFYWQATVLADSFAEALPVFADVICRPDFPPQELDRQ